MKISKKQFKILKWTSRILAVTILLFSLPFYFGYGNPLPFINHDYTLWDNTWLSVFPLMFIGLVVGLKHFKIGGFLVVVSLIVGFVVGFLIKGEIVVFMFTPFLVGLLYLLLGYNQVNK